MGERLRVKSLWVKSIWVKRVWVKNLLGKIGGRWDAGFRFAPSQVGKHANNMIFWVT